MKPIINPWWIYLAEKSETLQEGFLVFGVLALVACVVILVFNFLENFEYKTPKWLVAIAIIGMLFGSLLPNQKTILTMMTVQQLTPDNIKNVGNTVEDTIDYVVDKIEDLIDEKDN